MSFVLDQVRRIDAQLDRLQLGGLPSSYSTTTTSDSKHESAVSHGEEIPPRVLALQAAVRALSANPSGSLLRPHAIRAGLGALSEQVTGHVEEEEYGETHEGEKEDYEKELEWLLVSKATTQTYGVVVKRILDETVALADDVWYWDAVLSSQRYTALYSVQTSPLRLWHWSSAVWDDVKARGEKFTVRSAGLDASETLTKRWKEFYGLVRQVVRQRGVTEMRKYALSPVTRIRNEVRRKQAGLKRVRVRNANALGVLLGEGLANESAHGDGLGLLSPPSGAAAGHDLEGQTEQKQRHKWKASVARNVALMEAVLAKVNDIEIPVDRFDAAIAELTEDDPLYEGVVYDHEGVSHVSISPQAVAERLSRVLALALPQYAHSANIAVREHGKPSRIVRYWLPITIGVLSSSTVLRILVNRKAEIVQWIQDLGATTIDFWRNWVVEPTTKVLKTIRHDEGSEVSIMSKRSLEGDRDSLERMVVDFAVDNPANATGSTARLTEVEIADIRTKVREGDLTPVLRAYEKDLQSPFMGTVRGNLIRALLIQVQKTKVDVEVAIGGIDSLLKSQELVFGFVGLTPGILVSYFMLHYLRSSLSSKRGSNDERKQGKMLRQLRNMDRILTNSHPTEFGELYYKDQGLLLCETHVLRQEAGRVMPGEVFREFAEDVEEVCDVRTGVDKQRRVVERLRWAYGKWLKF